MQVGDGVVGERWLCDGKVGSGEPFPAVAKAEGDQNRESGDEKKERFIVIHHE